MKAWLGIIAFILFIGGISTIESDDAFIFWSMFSVVIVFLLTIGGIIFAHVIYDIKNKDKDVE